MTTQPLPGRPQQASAQPEDKELDAQISKANKEAQLADALRKAEAAKHNMTLEQLQYWQGDLERREAEQKQKEAELEWYAEALRTQYTQEKAELEEERESLSQFKLSLDKRADRVSRGEEKLEEDREAFEQEKANSLRDCGSDFDKLIRYVSGMSQAKHFIDLLNPISERVIRVRYTYDAKQMRVLKVNPEGKPIGQVSTNARAEPPYCPLDPSVDGSKLHFRPNLPPGRRQ